MSAKINPRREFELCWSHKNQFCLAYGINLRRLNGAFFKVLVFVQYTVGGGNWQHIHRMRSGQISNF